uniref:Isopenicillin N synthase-like Fe(2+) 2OG dioxygenase domain-containing protein n=1 Tax=Chenopodium quinoa TaxID=63459 RepID=A0A803LIY5_CHEQI
MDTQNAFNETQSSHDRLKELKEFDEGKLGVKGLVDAGIQKIPGIFVRPIEDRLKDFGTYSDDISVPVIDFSHFGENEDRTAEIIKETIMASKEWDAETKKLFYSRDFQSKHVYFFSNHDLYQSKAANWRDTLYVNARLTNGEVDPQELPPIYKDVTLEYVNHIHKLADLILMSISLGLGLEPECLGNMAKCTKSWAIINSYYPACPEPELTIGLDAHVDTSFITFTLTRQYWWPPGPS